MDISDEFSLENVITNSLKKIEKTQKNVMDLFPTTEIRHGSSRRIYVLISKEKTSKVAWNFDRHRQ